MSEVAEASWGFTPAVEWWLWWSNLTDTFYFEIVEILKTTTLHCFTQVSMDSFNGAATLTACQHVAKKERIALFMSETGSCGMCWWNVTTCSLHVHYMFRNQHSCHYMFRNQHSCHYMFRKEKPWGFRYMWNWSHPCVWCLACTRFVEFQIERMQWIIVKQNVGAVENFRNPWL